MELNIDRGLKSYDVKDADGTLIGTIRFNPSDIGLAGRMEEAPLDTIKQAVAEVMEDLQAGQMAGFEAVVSVLREILSAVYGIELTDEDVGRAVQRWQRKQAIATGGV